MSSSVEGVCQGCVSFSVEVVCHFLLRLCVMFCRGMCHFLWRVCVIFCKGCVLSSVNPSSVEVLCHLLLCSAQSGNNPLTSSLLT